MEKLFQLKLYFSISISLKCALNLLTSLSLLWRFIRGGVQLEDGAIFFD